MTEVIISPSVTLVNGIPSVTSVKIAQHFGKRHDHVLEAIRKLHSECPADFTAPNFRASTCTDSTGRELPLYHLTRDGFTLLAMGFTGKRALVWKIKYIEAFTAMEKALAAKAKPKAKALPRSRRKALPPADSPQAQIDAILEKVRFYLREIRETKDKTNSIVLAEHYRLHPDRKQDMGDPRYCLHFYTLCGTQALWQSIDFALNAVEESFTFRMENCL